MLQMGQFIFTPPPQISEGPQTNENICIKFKKIFFTNIKQRIELRHFLFKFVVIHLTNYIYSSQGPLPRDQCCYRMLSVLQLVHQQHNAKQCECVNSISWRLHLICLTTLYTIVSLSVGLLLDIK